ncbi:hypothetical protein BN59_03050 [Legionella massiliensis]|uniref:Uncharacterized protein n=1 Tax=Legionella massiliensis TaxID=1034943 RepID=A0A078L0E9_9GAMM|nr:hypothetical protein [Legionella massiliensis]CDZ78737.1 hypothetical protein BN59_03050 [Legionella massiliensis]CEE14475.1 hypothetical protein BN1094_03050 [Legionella massiliensis]
MFHRYLALSIMFIIMPFTADAKDVLNPASLGQAQKLIDEGKNIEAITILDRVIDSVWDKIPFQISFFTLTENSSKGFGMFNARKTNIYSKDNAEILLYLEPIGYKFASEKMDLFKFGCSMDLYLLNKEGKVVFNKENFLNQELMSHFHNREFFLNVTLSLTGLEIGDYTIKLITHDTVGKQQTETLVPIVITGETGGSIK